MAALLVSLSVMAIVMSAVLPVWKQTARREKEAELIFRGQQYARAIDLMQRKMPGALPPNLDILVDQRFLRKKYKDPITGEDFDVVRPMQSAPGLQPGQQPGTPTPGRPAPNLTTTAPQRFEPGSGASIRQPAPARAGGPGITTGAPAGGLQTGISGVASKSKDASLRIYNGRTHYNEWQFIHVPRVQTPGAGTTPGQPGAPGRGLGPQGPGTGPGRGGRGSSPFGGPGSGAPGGRGSQPFPPNRPPGN